MNDSPVPAQINVGDTLAAEYPAPEIPDLYKPDGDPDPVWKLLLQPLDPAVSVVTSITGAVADKRVKFILDNGLTEGSYRWRMIAELPLSTRRVRRITALEGYIIAIQPEVKASFTQRIIPVLEALYEDRVKGRGDVVSYMVAGRNYMAMSLRELRNEINFYKHAARQGQGRNHWLKYRNPFGDC